MIRNLLSPQTAGTASDRTASIGTWSDIANATLSYSSLRFKVGSASFLVTHTGSLGSTAVVASGTTGTRTRVSEGTLYRADVWFHHNRRLRPVRIGLEFFDVNNSSIIYISRLVGMTCATTANVRLDDWTLGTIEANAPVDAQTAVIRVELPNLTADIDDGLLWIDSASLVEYAEPSTTTVNRMLAFIPEYMDEADRTQVSPTRPLARFLDLLGVQLEEIRLTNFAFDYRSPADGGNPDDTSILVDPSGYPTSGVKQEWLPWIGQHLGVPPAEIQGGFTPWFFLENTYPTWSAWETEINENPASPPLSIVSSSRSAGISEIETSEEHGLSVGDVVTIETSPPSDFDGIYSVASLSSATRFNYIQQYGIVSIVRPSGSSEVTVVGVRPHGLTPGASVSVTGTGDVSFDGIHTVIDVFQAYDDGGFNGLTYNTLSTSAANSYAGVFYPVDASPSSSSGTVEASSDLAWKFIEGDNPYPIAADIATAELIRSGATGIWAGTVEGMKRSARVALGGSETVDLKASLSTRDGLMTIVCREDHYLNIGDFVEVYRCPEASLNGVYPVASVASSQVFTVFCRQGTFTSSAWITSKRAEIEKNQWHGRISSIDVVSNVMTIRLLDAFPAETGEYIDGGYAISGTGNILLDGASAPSFLPLADRFTLQSDTALSDLSIPALPSTAKILTNLSGATSGAFCFLLKTLASQTLSAEQTVFLASQAKPSGSIITHSFIA
jgi:hypothetical protein